MTELHQSSCEKVEKGTKERKQKRPLVTRKSTECAPVYLLVFQNMIERAFLSSHYCRHYVQKLMYERKSIIIIHDVVFSDITNKGLTSLD